MKKLSVIANILGSMLFLSACSHETTPANKEMIDVEATASITINTEDYAADQSVTRSIWADSIETVNLGGDLIAEVSLEADPNDATATRAALSEDCYTIYALDGGGTRVATMTGKVKNGKFVRDSHSSAMRLAPGTYTFVCINDGVSDNTTSLSVTNGSHNPMVGVVTQSISSASWQLAFEMKHLAARVQFNIISYTSASSGVTAKIASTSAQLNKNTYDIKGETVTNTESAAVQTGQYAFAASPAATRSFYSLPYNGDGEGYQYLLPNLEGKDLQLTFDAGTVYGESLAGKSIKLTKLGKLLKNSSYKMNIKLKKPLYLFGDGTVGTFQEKAERHPIAVVVTDKTTAEKGLAVALKSKDGGSWVGPTKRNQQNNSSMSEDFLTQWNDYNGYKWTWEASGSKDNVTIKAEAKDDFPAFYAAAHYNSGVPVTGTNIGKWFLPAFGQWKLLLVRLCGLDADAITTWGPYAWGPYPLFKKPLDAAFDNIFTQAGGVTLRDDWCWSSSERNITNSNDVTIRTNHVETEEQGYGKDAGEVVRSFVHF